jgi:hypothetical protein
MLFERIKNDTILAQFIRDKCEDEGICVDIDERISEDKVLIIKVDDYYNSLNIKKRPPSPDCFILVKCESGIEEFCLTIVELKNTGRFDFDNVEGKFLTCFNDFMSTEFKDYFNRDFIKIQLLLVSQTEIYKRDLGLKMKALMNKRIVFRDKKYMITPKMPTPAVKSCYC